MKKALSIALAAIMGMGLMVGTGCSHKHEFGDWKTLVSATCIHEGRERRDCQICEFYQTRQVEKTAHTTDKYSADDTKHWKECSVCHQHIDEEEHNFSGSYCTVCQYDKNGTGVLKYELNEDGKTYTVTGVQGTAPESVVIPGFYVGYPVTAIAKGAFVEQSVMKSVSLPSQLTTIEDGAFEDCTALVSLDIPASVKDIGKEAFVGCTALESITVANGNAFYSSSGGVLYDLLKTKFIHVPMALGGEFEIPAGITKIENGVFSGRNLEKVTIGEHVKEVALHAFLNCKNLKEFIVKGSDTTIGKAALAGCTSLQRLELANTWQSGLLEPVASGAPNDRATGDSYIGYIFGAEMYFSTGSVVPASLKTVEFTGGEKLVNYTFQACASIEEVIVPATVTNIGDKVFIGCDALKKVTVAEENPGYSSLDGVLYSKTGTGLAIKFIPAALSGVVRIAEGIIGIGNSVFQERPIEKLVIPASLRTIGPYAFNNCASLAEVEIPEESGLYSIGEFAFMFCKALKSIYLPADLHDIGQGAFADCEKLEAVNFAEKEGWTQKGAPIDGLNDAFVAAQKLKTSSDTWMHN